jgi:hypothetical protein
MTKLIFPQVEGYQTSGIQIEYIKSRDILNISGFYDNCVGIEGTEIPFTEFCDKLGISLNRSKVKDGKKTYGEFNNVSLSDTEYNKLIAKFGESTTKEWIEKLSCWKESKGKRTKSDYATILNWERMDRKNGTYQPRFSQNTIGKTPTRYTRPDELRR